MSSFSVLVTVFCIFSTCYTASDNEKGCIFTLNDNIPKTSMMLKNQDTPELIYPDKKNIIIPEGDEFRISCGEEYINNAFYMKEILAACVKDDLVKIKFHSLYEKKIPLRKLECQKLPAVTYKYTGKNCAGENNIIEVGYQINESFLKIYSVCYDNFEEKSIYLWYTHSKLHTGKVQKIRNPDLVIDTTLHYSPTDIYNDYDYQLKQFTKLLLSSEIASKYIEPNEVQILIGIPLISKNEFVFGPEQIATFHFLNRVPQWKLINEGNWAILENSLTNFLKNQQKEYGIAGGVYEIIELPDIFQAEKKIYLQVDENDNNYLPVPKYHWKIVYDYETKTGIAIVVINDPYLDEENLQSQIFCQDKCNEVSWLTSYSKHIFQGYLFCCDLNEFLSKIKYDNMFE